MPKKPEAKQTKPKYEPADPATIDLVQAVAKEHHPEFATRAKPKKSAA